MQNVFLVCFSVTSVASLGNVEEKWIPEVHHHCPEAPIILVGTKADLRENPDELARLEANGEKVVNEELVIMLSSRQTNHHNILSKVKKIIREQKSKGVKLSKYIECSAIHQKNLKGVFDEAIRIALFGETNNDRKKKPCNIF